MLRALRFAVALAVSVTAVACVVQDRTVVNSSGEITHLIRCQAGSSCYAAASQACPQGYQIRSGDTTSRMTIVCDGEGEPRAEPVAAEAVANDDPRTDTRTCEAASKYTKELGVYWALHAEAKLLAELPSQRDFIAVCREMPENAQRCLHAKYRDAHGDACDAVLSRLDPFLRLKVDALFLAAPQAKPVKRDDSVGRSL